MKQEHRPQLSRRRYAIAVDVMLRAERVAPVRINGDGTGPRNASVLREAEDITESLTIPTWFALALKNIARAGVLNSGPELESAALDAAATLVNWVDAMQARRGVPLTLEDDIRPMPKKKAGLP